MRGILCSSYSIRIVTVKESVVNGVLNLVKLYLQNDAGTTVSQKISINQCVG
jgi:hypothetical protein